MVIVDLSPSEEEAIKARYRLRRRLQLALIAPLLAAIVVILAELSQPVGLADRLGIPDWAIHAAGAVVVLAAVAFWIWTWRCPACRRHLRAELRPSFCARCGCPFD